MSCNIENDILKNCGIKLRKRRKKDLEVKNRATYEKEQNNSKNIEIKAARIEPKVEVVEEDEVDEEEESDSDMDYW